MFSIHPRFVHKSIVSQVFNDPFYRFFPSILAQQIYIIRIFFLIKYTSNLITKRLFSIAKLEILENISYFIWII